MRKDIPPLFGLAFNKSIWEQGFVVLPTGVYLLVTLDKAGKVEEHRYEDKFLSPSTMQWQSQNRTTQAGKHGQILLRHRERGVPVHLFVRRTAVVDERAAPFIYCGEVDLEAYEGEKPITVRWRLRNPVPERLRVALEVPPGPG
jgi:hypothetical protein